jgi:dihydrofolate synthase/folylpolyglutamate synthase
VTYFEALTAMAYLWFADKPVSLGVFEVGVGGSWDATNLIRGDVAIICPIGLDHPQLWSTVEETATDKAGIMKEGRPAVVREQRPEAMDVLRRRADQEGATILLEGQAFDLGSRTPAVGGQTLVVRGLHGEYDDLFLPMWGEQSARNAAAAIAAVEALIGRALDPRAVRTALGGATSPGRLEVVSRKPLVVLDGAHNEDAAAALAAALSESFTWEHLHLVLAMFADKYVEDVVGTLAPMADRAYVARNASPRSAPAERLVAAFDAAGVTEIQEHATVPWAVRDALDAAGPNDLVLVTGSFYTVGDARPLFTGASARPRLPRGQVHDR